MTRALGHLWHWIAHAVGWSDGVLRFRHGVLPDALAQAGSQQMQDVYERMPAAIKAQALVQGLLSKAAILQRHRRRVDEGHSSTIFGLAAFQEGVDLPGAYCTRVVIAKLPFAVPAHPWEQARAEWVQRCRRSALGARRAGGLRAPRAGGWPPHPNAHGSRDRLDP